MKRLDMSIEEQIPKLMTTLNFVHNSPTGFKRKAATLASTMVMFISFARCVPAISKHETQHSLPRLV